MSLRIFTLAWVVLLVTVNFSSATSSKNDTHIDPTMNFVVFVDDDMETTKDRISMARKQLKSTGGDTIGKTIIISFLNQPEETFESYIQEESKHWKTSNEAPAVVFDFTQRAVSSALVKRFSYKSGYPLVSTNHIKDDLVWSDITRYFRNNTVQFRSPDQTVEEVVAKMISDRHSGDGVCVQFGVTVKFAKFTYEGFSRDIVFGEQGFTLSTDRDTRLPQLVDELKMNTIFTYGTAEELTGILKEASKRNLLDEYHSWWATLSDYEETFDLPQNVNKLILLTFEFAKPGLEKSMKSFNTKSIIDLFYVDVIVATCKTIETMKKDKSWTKAGAHLNLVKPLSKRLLSAKENIFGKYFPRNNLEKMRYVYATNSKLVNPYIWELEVKSLKAELLTRGNRTILGKTQRDNSAPAGFFNRSTIDRFKHYDPVAAPLRATIVVDPPFVIKNETCVAMKKKMQQKLTDCFSGYVIDVLEKLKNDTEFNYSIESETTYGEQKEDGTWTGARGALSFVQNKRRNIQLGIGAFRLYHESDKNGPQCSSESPPIFFDHQSNRYYGFLFGGFTLRTYSIYPWKFNYGIKDLRARRYFEHL